MIGTILKAAISFFAPGLSAALAVLKTIASAIWTFIRRPPGSYIALLGAVVLAWWLSGHLGYSRGATDTKASDAVVWAAKVDAANLAAREDGILRGNITKKADLDYAFLQGKNEGAAAALQSQLNQKGTVYVPQIITIDCVPNGFVKLLDAAGLGIADPHALPGSADEPDEACSGLSLRDVESLLVQALSERHDFEDRLLNIQGWATKQLARNIDAGKGK